MSVTTSFEEKRLIERAKKVLMTCLNMSESEAHSFIQKQAMNLRISKLQMALEVLKMYEQ